MFDDKTLCSCETYSCEDGCGEEDCLDVIPVGVKALAYGVNVVLDGIVHHGLVLRKQAVHPLLIAKAGPGGHVAD